MAPAGGRGYSLGGFSLLQVEAQSLANLALLFLGGVDVMGRREVLVAVLGCDGESLPWYHKRWNSLPPLPSHTPLSNLWMNTIVPSPQGSKSVEVIGWETLDHQGDS